MTNDRHTLEAYIRSLWETTVLYVYIYSNRPTATVKTCLVDRRDECLSLILLPL